MAKNTKNVRFRTQRQSVDQGFRRFSVAFAAGVLIILFVSCLAILNKYDFDVRTAMGGDSVTETQPVSEESTEWQGEANKTYFFYCADSESKRLRFAWLVNFRLPGEEMRVCALASDTLLANGTETLNSMLSKYGADETVKRLEELTGLPIEGYIGSDDESFKAMINYFGGTDVNVPEQIEYRGDDFTVILVKGRQNLKADSLFKYLRYLNTLGPRGKSLQATALADIIESIIKPSNIGKTEKYFSKLSNTVETNLSIVDYSQSEEAIKSFMRNGIRKRYIVDSFVELNED